MSLGVTWGDMWDHMGACARPDPGVSLLRHTLQRLLVSFATTRRMLLEKGQGEGRSRDEEDAGRKVSERPRLICKSTLQGRPG